MHEILVVQCPHVVGHSKFFMLVSEMHLSGMFRAPKLQVRWAIGGSTWANPAARAKKKIIVSVFFCDSTPGLWVRVPDTHSHPVGRQNN